MRLAYPVMVTTMARGEVRAGVGIPPTALIELVAGGAVTVLSGAGLSTESGIPDYRGPDGRRRVTPMTIAEYKASAANRRRYWARSFVGWPRFAAASPNDGHRAVTALQRAGLLAGIVTQNVDGLHQRAGSVGVVDLHGRLDRVVCLRCGDRSDREVLQHRMAAANPWATALDPGAPMRPDGDVDLTDEQVGAFVTPDCPRCDSDLLKPEVVFFGESVDRATVARCAGLVASSRALLVLGSSLAVMSGLRFVRQAAAAGQPVGIVTLLPTRGDALATVRWPVPLGQGLTRLVHEIVPPSRG